MVKRILLQVLLIATTLNVSSSHQASYCIGNSSLTDCPPGCNNFYEVAGILKSNSTVNFCPGRLELNSSLVLTDLFNVTFLGRSHTETVLTCTHQGAGLTLVNMSQTTFKNLKIENCGHKHNSTTQVEISGVLQMVQLSSAIYVINCSNFRLERVRVSNSHGLGVVLYDTSGVVEILHSVFNNNSLKYKDGTFGGGGVYVEFTVCAPGVYCTNFENKTGNTRARGNLYKFENCTFQNNVAYLHGPTYVRYSKDNKPLNHQGLGRGGGLSIQLSEKSIFNTFIIENCTFIRNRAKWGGGLYIIVRDSSSHNVLQLKKLKFVKNRSVYYSTSGGGVELGFNIATSNNSVEFYRCNFIGNKANLGGGVGIYSSQKAEPEHQNRVEFRECQWIENIARFGSAIDIAPHGWEVLTNGFLPVPLFHNCEFTSNTVNIFSTYKTTGYTVYKTGRGAMMLTKFTANFSGFINFVDNDGSAVYLSSSIISMSPNTKCNFISNRGFEGGAIAFVGFSALFVKENNHFYFAYNTATLRGGAIFVYNIDKHDFVSSRSCFIQYHGIGVSEERKNVTFEFVNNSAGYKRGNLADCPTAGHSIYSSSLLTCIHACKYFVSNKTNYSYPAHNQSDPFTCIGDFQFLQGADMKCQVSTLGGRVDTRQLKFNNTLEMYPGRDMMLNISVLNDFSQPMNTVYYASLILKSQNNSNITINHAYSFVSNRRMRLHGTPGSAGVLRLQQLGFREIMLDINVSLIECPPGYVLDEFNYYANDDPVFGRCVCSTVHSSTSFKPIVMTQVFRHT